VTGTMDSYSGINRMEFESMLLKYGAKVCSYLSTYSKYYLLTVSCICS
jgi:hypothetical protein